MKETESRLLHTAAVCIIISFATITIYLGSDIISPLVLALFFAVLLRPTVNMLHIKLRIPHLVAVALAVLVAIGVGIGVVMFMSIQVSEFVSDIPAIKHKLEQHFLQIQNWLNDVFGLTF